MHYCQARLETWHKQPTRVCRLPTPSRTGKSLPGCNKRRLKSRCTGWATSVDEKSQIQALDRTQPVLPLRSGIPARQTHDYKRNGTTTLFAALSMLDGKVIGHCMPRHRHQEFIRFLKQIDADTPAGLDLHLIVDNYGTHKHPRVQSWLRRHPRFFLHFIPTSSSWLNMVERWFREITDKRLRRGTFDSERTLIKAIMDYIDNHNQNPKAFVWTASAEAIMRKIRINKEALESRH